MFKFLHAADIHLDSPMLGLERYPGVPVDDVRLATRKALDNLVALAIEQAVAFVLIAGDLYDGTWKDFNTGLYFGQAMTRLRDADIDVLIVAGNHDAESQVQRQLSMPPNVSWLPTSEPKTVVLDQLGVAIHGQGYASYKLQDNLARGFPEPQPSLFNIGLLHTALDGRPGHDRYAPCSLQDLRAKRYDYWALGHVHDAEIVCRDPWVVFSGNTQGRNVRETGPKGCSLVSVAHGKVICVEPRSLEVLRWFVCSVDATGCDHPDDIVANVADAVEIERQKARDKMLAVRVEICGPTAAHLELVRAPETWTQEIRQAVGDRTRAGAWVEKVRFKTTPDVSLQQLRMRDDPLGELMRAIERMQSDERPLDSLLREGSELSKDFAELRRMLSVAGAVGLTEFDEREILSEVKSMLISRLIATGEP